MGEKGRRYQLCHQFLAGSRYGNVPNELIHRAGPPFLGSHYCGYQLPVHVSNYKAFDLRRLRLQCVCV